ncbi:hypothetical protein LB515_21815 [Mesorhizobium sp. CA15]|uniref:hypothetical protein n=1 Tax=Mesorhizobium sp. CA15 TaxID=2876641 RepID=UPI001CD06AA8|nr:hypothetical protein [Mesorhizobium sp. CA15]MBZ9868020.1 hypothetical protein [Mesorhizobium sp. CA15]
MVHIIPLFVGERRLDTGNAVQYPDTSPVGEAMQQLGDRWQAAAERYEQRKAQQQAFDTEIAAHRLNGELAQAEAETVANSPADGAGLHEAMYGQVDPYTGQVVRTGQFDTLFGNFLKQVPPELRPGLASRKEALREAGAIRLALQQNQRRKQYEQDQVAEVHTAELDNIARSDPNDTAAFDASRQAGLDLVAKMDLDPQIRLQAEADWRARTAKARMQALIEQDPRRAAEMLSAGSVASDGMGETVRAQLGAAAQDEQAAAKGDWRRNKTPDEMIAQAFGDIPEEEQQAIRRQAQAASLAQEVKIRAAIDRAEAEAPDEIARTGSYSGHIPGDDAYKIVYGPEEGIKRRQGLEWQVDVGKKIFDMGAMSNQAINAALNDAEAASSPDKERDGATAVAAKLVLERRRVDSGGYVSDTSQDISAGWKAVFGTGPSDPEAYDQDTYDRTIELSVARQKALGIDDENLQPVPFSILLKLAEDRDSGSMYFMDNYAKASELFLRTKGPVARAALVRELDAAGLGGILPGGKPRLSVGEVFRADAKALGKETANAGILAGKLIKGAGYVVSLGSTERPDFGHGYYEPANSTEKVMMRQGGDAWGWAIPGPGVGRAAESAIPRAVGAVGSQAAAQIERSIVTNSSEGASLARPMDEIASRSANIYDPQTKTARSIFDDYPGAVKADDNEKLLIDPRTGRQLSDPETGRLLYDPEGRALGGKTVVGRRVVGGEDVAIVPEELDDLAEAAIGSRITADEARAFSRREVGKYIVARGLDGPERSIHILNTLRASDATKVGAHEIGHMIDDLAGKTVGHDRVAPVRMIDQDGIKAELRWLYNDLNNPFLQRARAAGQAVEQSSSKVYRGFGPEQMGYKKGIEADRELMAEAIRAYMANPNYMKTVAPKTAARIRAYVNEHKDLKHIIQFNSVVGAAGGTAGAGAILDSDGLDTERGQAQ